MLEEIVLWLIDKQLQWDLVGGFVDMDKNIKDKHTKAKEMLDQLRLDYNDIIFNNTIIKKFYNALGHDKLLSKVPYKSIVTLMLVNYLAFIIKSTDQKVF